MDPTPAWTAVDPLGEALHFLRMSGVLYCHSECTAPWGVALPQLAGCLMLHVVTSGHCWLEAEGTEPRRLQPGDLALVPHGQGHRLVHEPGAAVVKLFDAPLERLNERYETLRIDGGGSTTSMVCGVVRFDHLTAHHLITVLPRVLVVEASGSAQSEWMHSTLRLLALEARQMRPGAQAVVSRLADILLIQAIRAWIEQEPAAQGGWLGALKDRQIGRALALVHRDPARNWALGSLAAEVGLSRSAFAARFTQLVGLPPMQYLGRWRMHVAMARLQEHDDGLAELAGRVGYQSEAAFSRAFKRHMGVAPGAIQKTVAL
jgi:AraC-like DNA-binding protein